MKFLVRWYFGCRSYALRYVTYPELLVQSTGAGRNECLWSAFVRLAWNRHGGSYSRHTDRGFSTDVTNFHSHRLHKSLAIGAFCQNSHVTHTVLSLLTTTIKTKFILWKVYPVSFWVTRHLHFWTELKLPYVCRCNSPPPPTCSVTHIE